MAVEPLLDPWARRWLEGQQAAELGTEGELFRAPTPPTVDVQLQRQQAIRSDWELLRAVRQIVRPAERAFEAGTTALGQMAAAQAPPPPATELQRRAYEMPTQEEKRTAYGELLRGAGGAGGPPFFVSPEQVTPDIEMARKGIMAEIGAREQFLPPSEAVQAGIRAMTPFAGMFPAGERFIEEELPEPLRPAAHLVTSPVGAVLLATQPEFMVLGLTSEAMARQVAKTAGLSEGQQELAGQLAFLVGPGFLKNLGTGGVRLLERTSLGARAELALRRVPSMKGAADEEVSSRLIRAFRTREDAEDFAAQLEKQGQRVRVSYSEAGPEWPEQFNVSELLTAEEHAARVAAGRTRMLAPYWDRIRQAPLSEVNEAPFASDVALASRIPRIPEFAPEPQQLSAAQTALDIEMTVNEDVGRLVRTLGRVPGIKTVINLANGSALLEREGVGWSAVRRLRRADQWTQEAARFEEQMEIKANRLFKIREGVIDGLGTDASGRPAIWQDVFTDPSRWSKLTKDQRDYINLWHQIKNSHKAVVPVEAWRGRLGVIAKGEDFLADNWVPRFVLETRGVERGALVKRAFGAKQAMERGRFYEFAAEGTARGNVYHDSPSGTLGLTLRAYGQLAADAEARTLLKTMTKPLTEFLPPAVRERTEAATEAWTSAQRNVRTLEAAARGEEWVTRIGKNLSDVLPPKMQERLSKIQAVLRLGRGARRAELETQLVGARAELKAATQAYNAAKRERARAMEMLRGGTAEHPLPPREMPGLSGRLVENRELYDQMVKWYGQRVPDGLSALSLLNAVLTPFRAVGDLSFSALQGLMGFYSNPIGGLEAFGAGVEAVFSQSHLYGWVMKGLERRGVLDLWIRGGGKLGAADYVIAPVRSGPLKYAAKAVNWTLTPFARAWTRGRNVTGLVNFEGRYAAQARKLGRALNDNELRELVSVTDKMTGILDSKALGVQATQRAIERSVRFAPSYYRAYLGLLADAFQGGVRGSEARRLFALFIAGGTSSYLLAARGLNQEPDLNPKSPNFYTLKIAGQKVGFGGVYYNVMRLIGEMGEAIVEGDYGRLYDIRSGRHPLARQLRSGAAPVLSIAWDIAARSTFIGKPLNTPAEMLRHVFASVMPFGVQTLIEEGPGQVIPQFFGLRSFPEFATDRAERVLKKPKEKWTKLDYRVLEDEFPGIYGDMVDYRNDAAATGQDWAIVAQKEEAIRNEFGPMIAALESERDPSVRMDRYAEIIAAQGERYAQLQNEYPDVYKKRDEKDLNTREQEIVAEGGAILEKMHAGMEPSERRTLLEEYDAWEGGLEEDEVAFWDRYRDLDAPRWLQEHRQRNRVLERRFGWWDFRDDLWKGNVSGTPSEKYATFADFQDSIRQQLYDDLPEGASLSPGAVDRAISDLLEVMPELAAYLKQTGTSKESETDWMRRELPEMEALLLANGHISCVLTDDALLLAQAPPLNIVGADKCQRA